jgi:hypothetical protein
MVSAAAVWLACQAAGPANVGGTTTWELLLNDADVQKELNISAEQTKKIQELCRVARTQVLARYRNYRAPTPDMAQAKSNEALDRIYAETAKSLATVLADEQFDRLKQIDRQQRGLRDAEAQQALKLSRDQLQRIMKIRQTLENDTLQAFKKLPRNDLKAKTTTWQDLRKKAVEQEMEVLTADQRKMWQERVGDAFELFKFDESNGIPPRIASAPLPQPRGFWPGFPIGNT